jgi:hypothetical protein
VVVRFEDGSERRLDWGDADRWRDWEFVGPSRAASAQIDPGRKVLLDVQKLDDGRRRDPVPLASRRWSLEMAVWLSALFAAVEAL